MIWVSEEEPETWYGQHTGAKYPWDETPILFVDARDAIYMLGTEVEILE